MADITDEQVAAAWRVAWEWIESPFQVTVLDYVRGPDNPPPGPERDAALAAMHAAQAEADRRNDDVMRAILAAAQAARA